MWTKCGVGHDIGHGLPYGLPYGLPMAYRWSIRLSIVVNLCKQRALSICHGYDSLHGPLGGVLLKFSKQTIGRSESEKPECSINTTFAELSNERAFIIKYLSRILVRWGLFIPYRLSPSFCHLHEPLLACNDRRILGREVCKMRIYNQVCNKSAHSLYDNKHDYFNTEGLHVFSSLKQSIMQTSNLHT